MSNDPVPMTDAAGTPITVGPSRQYAPLQPSASVQNAHTGDHDAKIPTHTDDMQRCMAELQTRWGNEFDSRLALVKKYVSNLPPSLQEHLMHSELPDGSLSGNSPVLLEQIWEEAIGARQSSAVVPVQLAGGNVAMVDLNAEIKSLENYMRTDRRAYLKDEAAQQRLRAMYAMRDGTDKETYYRKYGKA